MDLDYVYSANYKGGWAARGRHRGHAVRARARFGPHPTRSAAARGGVRAVPRAGRDGLPLQEPGERPHAAGAAAMMRAPMTRVLVAACAATALAVATAHAGQQSAQNHPTSSVKAMPPEGKYVPPQHPGRTARHSGQVGELRRDAVRGQRPRPAAVGRESAGALGRSRQPRERAAPLDGGGSARRAGADPAGGVGAARLQLRARERSLDPRDAVGALHHARRARRDVPGAVQQRLQHSPVARIRRDRLRDGPRRPRDPARRPAARRQGPHAVERRPARPLGGQHARHRDDQLQRQGDDRDERGNGAGARRRHERRDAPRRAHHAARQGHAEVPR